MNTVFLCQPPTANRLLPTANRLPPTAYCLLPTAYRQPPTANRLSSLTEEIINQLIKFRHRIRRFAFHVLVDRCTYFIR